MLARSSPSPIVCTTRPIAPSATKSDARTVAGWWKRSQKSTEYIRAVSACTRDASSSCSSVVNPGLSTTKSLPCRMTSMPRAARSELIAALATNEIEPSSRISATSRARRACGNRLPNSAHRTLGREKGNKLSAGVRERVHLRVDVIVIQTDGRESNARRGCRLPRFRLTLRIASAYCWCKSSHGTARSQEGIAISLGYTSSVTGRSP